MNKMKETRSASDSRKLLKRICTAAVFAAIVFIATGFLPRIPIGSGYVHIGDAAIYLCAAMLPAPFAAPAAAIGSNPTAVSTEKRPPTSSGTTKHS